MDGVVLAAGEGTPLEYVRQALPAVEGTFVVMNGDNVCRVNLVAVLERHRGTDAAATLLVEDVSREEASEAGVVETGPDDPPSTCCGPPATASRPSSSRAGVTT
ncbi:hypothetical protein ACFQGE_04650 [Halomicroarcula sp. GCM10025817]|uniref:hypothetical protein n=1 Tax=Haloarcula TaxID=2237 RepID=UPI0023E811BA|nr:hypothetical protein [Halomicroarcula sp. SYNS111]